MKQNKKSDSMKELSVIENLNTGYIKICRSIRKNWIWEDSKRLKWWIDILIEANYIDKKILIGGTLFHCTRGQCLYSLETWAKRWRTNKSNVRKFLYLLKSDNMVVLEDLKKTTRITVCNYDSYNDSGNADETLEKRQRNAEETLKKPTKERKNSNTSNEVLLVVQMLNEKTGRNFSPKTKATVKHIQARLKEGRTTEDFRMVIEKKTQQWQGDEKMNRFLRPETLFGGKFEGYLNETLKFNSSEKSAGYDDYHEFIFGTPGKTPGASVYSDNGQKNSHSE